MLVGASQGRRAEFVSWCLEREREIQWRCVFPSVVVGGVDNGELVSEISSTDGGLVSLSIAPKPLTLLLKLMMLDRRSELRRVLSLIQFLLARII